MPSDTQMKLILSIWELLEPNLWMFCWHKCNFCSFPGLPLELPKSFSPSKRGLWDLLWRPEPSLSSSPELTRESVWLFSNSWPPDSSSSPVSKIFQVALYATHTTFLIVVLRRQSCEINGRGNDFSNWFVLIWIFLWPYRTFEIERLPHEENQPKLPFGYPN